MLRRTWLRCIPLAEAKSYVFDAQGYPVVAPRTSLPQLLTALCEHYRTGGEAFAAAALHHVVQLDQSNEDTRHMAVARVAAPASRPAVDATAPPQAPPHLVTELLRTYPHTPEVRERCCRCIANVCQLSADGAAPASSGQLVPASRPSAADAAGTTRVADALVEDGAVELVLGTLAMAGRLSAKGRCWAAMAMLNLACMSRDGAARATRAGAVDRLAEFILHLLDDDAAVDGAAASSPIRGLGEERAVALDAALGALTGILSAEAPENSSGISFNYEAASYVAVDAVVRSLLMVSALLVRDGRNDGAYGASLPSRRYGTVHFATASPTQQTAVVVLLPLVHKAWMALQTICSRAANLPMVFDVVYEAANSNQESMVVAAGADEGAVEGEEVLQVTAQTERQYVAALSSLVDAALFLTTELEGLEAVGAEELARLQGDVQLYVMDTMEVMTGSRKDLSRRDAADTDGSGAADGATVYPTAAAMGVTEVLTTGTVSNMALACAVRLHASHQDATSGASASGRRGVAVPCTARDFTLLSKSLVVLANVAEVGDEVATSANAVAALQTIMQDAAEVVVTLPSAYAADLAELFRPTAVTADGGGGGSGGGEAAAATPASPVTAVIHADDRLAFLQQTALVGQVYAVLWSALRTAPGVVAVSQMRVLQTAREVQTALRLRYLPALAEAKARFSGSPASGEAAAAKTWVANTAEETVTRLLALSDELVSSLEKVSASLPHPPA